jgi:hypothetical protein
VTPDDGATPISEEERESLIPFKEFSMTRLLVFMLRLDRDIEIRIKKHRSSRVPPSIEVLAS